MMSSEGKLTQIDQRWLTVKIGPSRYNVSTALMTNIAAHFEIGDIVQCDFKPDGSIKSMILSRKNGEKS